MKDILKKDWVKYLAILISLYIISFFYCFNLKNGRWSFLIMFIVVITITVPIIYMCKRKELKLEKVFLIISIILGELYMFTIPLGAVPDEKSHFLRAYEITEGNFISQVDEETGEGFGELPEEIDTYFYDPKNHEISSTEQLNNITIKDSGNTKKYYYSGASLYSFMCYIPQTIGIMLGKIFSLNIIACAFLGRVFNFTVWTIIMYFAIKKIPFYKKFLIFISFLPITFQEAISLSADALTISMCIFFVSYVFNLAFSKESKLNRKQYVVLILSAIIISLCKIVYIPLCLLLLVIPNEKFENKKSKYIRLGTILLITALINLIWLSISSRYLVEANGGVDAKAQIIYILTNPLKYVNVLYSTLCDQGTFYLRSFFGESLEAFNVNLSTNYTYVMLSLMTILLITEKSEVTIDLKQRSITIITFIGIIGLIFTALYIQWTPFESVIVAGVQGRYFLPIALLLPIVLNRKKETKSQDIINRNFMFLFFIMINLYAITNISIEHIN